ncbi:MAG TPA: superoxide dismutase family protein [Chondromyces sp.]|nr:superoxide dismutase family protein [Chondromyces sp.]
MYVYPSTAFTQGYWPYRNQQRAYSIIKGGPLAPNIRGYVLFTEMLNGTMVQVVVQGLPSYQPGTEEKKQVGPHGFHLHEKGSCEIGNPEDPFQEAGGHWNPGNQPHGNHAGDFPVLFSNDGYANMSFFTNKFTPADLRGRAVIIHEGPDDYQSQPSGDAGRRLACGSIIVI